MDFIHNQLMKHFTIFTFILLFLSKHCVAQDYIDLIKVYYSPTPANNFDNKLGETNLSEVGIDVTFPLKINDSLAIITGIFAENIQTKLFPFANETTLSTINLRVGINKKYNQKWSGTYLLLPKISSDFNKFNSNHFQIGALGLVKYTKTTFTNYSIGLYYNSELFGPFFVPLFGAYHKSKNNKLEINLTLPIWADINYKLNNWLTSGVNFSAFVRSYYLGNSNAYVVKRNNELFGYLQFNLKQSLIFQTKIGYSIGRSFRVYNDDDKVDVGVSAFRFGDDRQQLNTDFEDGLVFNFRFIYRFSLSN